MTALTLKRLAVPALATCLTAVAYAQASDQSPGQSREQGSGAYGSQNQENQGEQGMGGQQGMQSDQQGMEMKGAESHSDQQLHAQVERQITSKTGGSIHVASVRNGVVSLEGNAKSASEKQQAVALARQVPGVRQVDDKMITSGGSEQ